MPDEVREATPYEALKIARRCITNALDELESGRGYSDKGSVEFELRSALSFLPEERMDVPVAIERDYLEILLSFAKIGDVAASQRRCRNGFRHVPICSPGLELECVSCQAFAGAKKALATSADEDDAFWERVSRENAANPETAVERVEREKWLAGDLDDEDESP